MTAVAPAAKQVTRDAGVSLLPIVDISWLSANLHDVVVVDTRSRNDYLDGHIPGAVSLPLASSLMDDTTQPVLAQLGRDVQSSLASVGITSDDTVCLVDHGDGSAQLGLIFCELAGIKRVTSVLGGQRAWDAAGNELQHSVETRDEASIDADLSFVTVASIEDVQYASHGATHLIDVRSQLEHEGIIGLPTCPVRGHIPGSLHTEWASLLNAGGQLRSADTVLADMRDTGLNTGDDIIVYCHNGIRAAVAAAVLRTAGFSRVRVSLGSWNEWALRGLPFAPEPD